jgi:hypothetical protein
MMKIEFNITFGNEDVTVSSTGTSEDIHPDTAGVVAKAKQLNASFRDVSGGISNVRAGGISNVRAGGVSNPRAGSGPGGVSNPRAGSGPGGVSNPRAGSNTGVVVIGPIVVTGGSGDGQSNGSGS